MSGSSARGILFIEVSGRRPKLWGLGAAPPTSVAATHWQTPQSTLMSSANPCKRLASAGPDPKGLLEFMDRTLRPHGPPTPPFPRAQRWPRPLCAFIYSPGPRDLLYIKSHDEIMLRAPSGILASKSPATERSNLTSFLTSAECLCQNPTAMAKYGRSLGAQNLFRGGPSGYTVTLIAWQPLPWLIGLVAGAVRHLSTGDQDRTIIHECVTVSAVTVTSCSPQR